MLFAGGLMWLAYIGVICFMECVVFVESGLSGGDITFRQGEIES